jgi:hypothetical protein
MMQSAAQTRGAAVLLSSSAHAVTLYYLQAAGYSHCDKTGSLHSVYNMSTKCFVDTFVDLFCRMLLFL